MAEKSGRNRNIASEDGHLAEDFSPPPGGVLLKRCSDSHSKNHVFNYHTQYEIELEKEFLTLLPRKIPFNALPLSGKIAEIKYL